MKKYWRIVKDGESHVKLTEADSKGIENINAALALAMVYGATGVATKQGRVVGFVFEKNICPNATGWRISEVTRKYELVYLPNDTTDAGAALSAKILSMRGGFSNTEATEMFGAPISLTRYGGLAVGFIAGQWYALHDEVGTWKAPSDWEEIGSAEFEKEVYTQNECSKPV